MYSRSNENGEDTNEIFTISQRGSQLSSSTSKSRVQDTSRSNQGPRRGKKLLRIWKWIRYGTKTGIGEVGPEHAKYTWTGKQTIHTFEDASAHKTCDLPQSAFDIASASSYRTAPRGITSSTRITKRSSRAPRQLTSGTPCQTWRPPGLPHSGRRRQLSGRGQSCS